jgi:antitoxin component of RelBE/YafQ-DinJ toxin-antitoxin module
MATLTIHKIDPALKAEAMEIMKQHGMTARATFESFLRRIVSDHLQTEDTCFCRELELNEETRKDLMAAKAGRVEYTECKDTDALFNKLGI